MINRSEEQQQKAAVSRSPSVAGRSSLGWGIIGCGWVARDYVAPAIRAASNARLVALCDSNMRALNRIAVDSPNAALYETPSDFLNCTSLDAVYIATPNDSHASLTVAAAGAEKHVLCEKPMATNAIDARHMVEACRAAGVIYATAFDQRFHARHQALREIIAAGRLGTITHARIHYACWNPPDWTPATDDGTHNNWRVRPEQAGGGAMIDLAPHGLDLMQYLLGEEIVEISCMMQRRAFDYSVDDGAVLIGRFRCGALLSMNVAYNCPDEYPRRTLEIIGTKGRAHAFNTMGQTPGGTLEIMLRGGASEEVMIPNSMDASPFQLQIETFSKSVISDEPFPFTVERDLHTMELIDEAGRQGARSLSPVESVNSAACR